MGYVLYLSNAEPGGKIGRNWRTIAADLAAVFKLRIGLAITLNALAGMALMKGPAPQTGMVVLLAAAVLASSASAGAFNHLMERDIDARMRRTAGRPFVSGAFKAGPLWLAIIAALLILSVGATAFVFNSAAAVYLFLGAFSYGVVYTVWLKRRTVFNIVIGGLAGSFAVLAGAAAIDPDLQAAPVILAITLFFWTPPHFWSLAIALKDDYESAGVPMLPVVAGNRKTAWWILLHTAILVGLSLLPVAFGLGWIYFAGAASGGSFFLWRSIGLVRSPTPGRAMAAFHASLVQVCLLLVGAIIEGLVAV